MNISINVYLAAILMIILFFSAIKDWKEQIIPNVYLVRGIAIRVLILLCEVSMARTNVVKKLVIKVGISVLILMIGILIRKLTKDGIGMGDIKVCAFMFLYLEPNVWFTSLFLSLILGALHALIAAVCKKENVRIPFAPALFLGTLATILFL